MADHKLFSEVIQVENHSHSIFEVLTVQMIWHLIIVLYRSLYSTNKKKTSCPRIRTLENFTVGFLVGKNVNRTTL